jgi:hypothetical protein
MEIEIYSFNIIDGVYYEDAAGNPALLYYDDEAGMLLNDFVIGSKSFNSFYNLETEYFIKDGPPGGFLLKCK